jgi:hypothetical protein
MFQMDFDNFDEELDPSSLSQPCSSHPTQSSGSLYVPSTSSSEPLTSDSETPSQPLVCYLAAFTSAWDQGRFMDPHNFVNLDPDPHFDSVKFIIFFCGWVLIQIFM